MVYHLGVVSVLLDEFVLRHNGAYIVNHLDHQPQSKMLGDSKENGWEILLKLQPLGGFCELIAVSRKDT
jgi:hypothetical protein